MKKLLFTTSLGILLIFLVGCPSEKRIIVGNYTFKTECLGIGNDGSQTLKVWGNGRNKIIAIEQAKKNAIRDVLFKGISDGKSDCDPRPIVTEVNAQSRYEKYFNDFFSDSGDYKKYVYLVEEKPGEVVFPDKITMTYSVIVNVKRAELKQKMYQDGILK